MLSAPTALPKALPHKRLVRVNGAGEAEAWARVSLDLGRFTYRGPRALEVNLLPRMS